MKKLIGAVCSIVLMMGCMSTSKVEEVKAESEIQNASFEAEPQQVPFGYYCCDAAGYRRCVMNASAPVGSPCWCNGQGSGWTCL